jgi:glycolate oxidase FAD binding subunit
LGNSTGKLQVRVGVAAKDVASYVNDQAGVLNRGTFLADMSSGLVYAMMPSDDVDEAKKWLERLRQPALAIDGYAMVMDMPDAWRGVIDRWGYRPQAIDLMRGLKERWDPRGVLNPGVFIV